MNAVRQINMLVIAAPVNRVHAAARLNSLPRIVQHQTTLPRIRYMLTIIPNLRHITQLRPGTQILKLIRQMMLRRLNIRLPPVSNQRIAVIVHQEQMINLRIIHQQLDGLVLDRHNPARRREPEISTRHRRRRTIIHHQNRRSRRTQLTPQRRMLRHQLRPIMRRNRHTKRRTTTPRRRILNTINNHLHSNLRGDEEETSGRAPDSNQGVCHSRQPAIRNQPEPTQASRTTRGRQRGTRTRPQHGSQQGCAPTAR